MPPAVVMLSVRLLFLNNIDSVCFSLPWPAMTKLIKGVLYWRFEGMYSPSLPHGSLWSVCWKCSLVMMDMGSEETWPSLLPFDDVRSIDDYFCVKKFISVKHLSFSLTAASLQRGKLYSRIPTRFWEKLWNWKLCGTCKLQYSCITESQEKVLKRSLQPW